MNIVGTRVLSSPNKYSDVVENFGNLGRTLVTSANGNHSPYQMALLSLSSNIVYPKLHHVSLHNHTSTHSFIKLFFRIHQNIEGLILVLL
jgi:hypothetical protein